MRTLQAFTASLAVLASTACATMDIGADYEQSATLTPFRSFSFDTRDALPTGDPRLDNNPFFDSRMRAAVEFEMAAKGLKRADTGTDLLVHYHASVSQRVDVLRSDTERGYSDVTGTPANVVQFDEGTILVDVVDAKSKRVIWRGWARADMGGVLSDPHTMDAFVQKAVHGMFTRFLKAA
ncbi:MAG: DUF4136 domain-containing protein [Gemmatimonadaceae bacterium]